MKLYKSIVTFCIFLIGYSVSGQTGNVGIGTATPGSKLTVSGSMAATYTSVSASGAVGANDYYIAYSANTNGTLTLPASVSGAGNFSGRMYHFKNTGSATLTIAANGSEQIDNQSGAGVPNVSVPSGYYAFFINKGTTSGTTWELVLLSSSNSVPSSVSTFPFSTVATTTRQTCTSTTTPTWIVTEYNYPEGTVVNTNNVLNQGTGRFTAPSAGFYVFFGSTQFDNSSLAGNPGFNWAVLYLLKDGATTKTQLVQHYVPTPFPILGVNISYMAYLNANETISLGGAASVTTGTQYQVVGTVFYGYKISN